jgi:hypothetical protein
VNAEALLRDRWTKVYRWARGRSSRIPRLSLHVGCRQILTRRHKDARAFMHVGHVPGKVCTVLAASRLSDNHLVGLTLHELGHPLAEKAWGVSEQAHADMAVGAYLGVRISYRGKLVLQWVSNAVTKTILGGR